MSKPLPWSFSSLNKFTTCPLQYYETKVLKNFKDEPGEVAKWGTYVHLCAENFVKHGTPFPENVQVYVADIMKAITLPLTPIILAENELALSSQFAPCEWDSAWVRGIIDLLKVYEDTAWAIDWKLGKMKPDSKQLKLFALLIFYHYPAVNTVHTSFEWLQFRTRTQETYTRAQIPELWDAFVGDLGLYVRAFKTDTWQQKQSGLCGGWCPVDTCPNWRPKR